MDYKSQIVDIEGKRVKCQIWDTAGQQRFHVITHSYYKSAQGIVLVYDASDTTEERCGSGRLAVPTFSSQLPLSTDRPLPPISQLQ